MQNITRVLIFGTILLAGPALACDQNALESNMKWAVANNDSARAQIAQGYDMLGKPGFDSAGLTLIENAFRDAQKHNPSAANTINGCGALTVAEAARRALGKK